MRKVNLSGLIAAPFTPFHSDLSLNLDVVNRYSEHLVRDKVLGVFVGGTTGESASLTCDERIALTEAWRKAAGAKLKVIVHVGHNCLSDCQRLASHAEAAGADCIAAVMPSFFKPATLAAAVDFCRKIAAAAPKTPFYYYHIPDMSGVNFDMTAFVPEAEASIPTFRGVKFTHSNIMDYSLTLAAAGGRHDILFGRDENLLAGLSYGAKGAVGSTYNYSAALYLKLMKLYSSGKREAATRQQVYIQRAVLPIIRYGGLPAGKAVMAMVGVDCGPVRPPLRNLDPKVHAALKKDLEAIKFFAAVKA